MDAASTKDSNLAVGCSEGVEFILFIQVLEKNACYFSFFVNWDLIIKMLRYALKCQYQNQYELENEE